MSEQQQSPQSAGNLLAGGVVVVSLVLFGVGTTGTWLERERSTGSWLEPDSVEDSVGDAKAALVDQETQAVPSQPYRDLRLRRWGPNSRVTSSIDRLRDGIPAKTDEVAEQSSREKARALTARLSRRAYDGAPPTVPHDIDEQNASACLACHRDGMSIRGRVAPVLSHAELASCTQCHVPAGPRPWSADPHTSDTAAPAPAPRPGERAWQGAPPLIPHTLQMRQQCASCHGVTGRDGLRTRHPERVSCRQCHVSGGTEVPLSP